MPVFKSILAAVDFSDHSAQALRCAVTVAAIERARLHVITVVDPLLAEAAAAAYDLDTLSAETEAELRGFVASALAAPPQTGRREGAERGAVGPASTELGEVQGPLSSKDMRVVIGRAPREILRAAETLRADLIVLGTQGLGGFRKLFFGSTTDHVLRDAGTAVLAVPLPAHAGENPLERQGPIIAGVDVERQARPLVETAVALARDFKSALVLLHVVAPIQTAARWRRHAERVQPSRRERAAMALDALVIETRDGNVVEAIAETGDPPSVIAKAAAERQARLIVIGLGRQHGIGHRPGSTAYGVVCCSEIPALAIPETAH